MPTADPTLNPPKSTIKNVSLPSPLWDFLDTVAEQIAVPRSRIIRAAAITFLIDNVAISVDGRVLTVTGGPPPDGWTPLAVVELSPEEYQTFEAAI